MKSKTVATSGTAQTVTLAKAAADSTIKHAVVINHSATTAEVLYFTVAANGATPTTAVAEADDTIPVLPGQTVPVNVGSTDEVKVSIISASGTPKATVLGQ